MRGESGDKMLTDSDDHDRQHNCLDSGGGGGSGGTPIGRWL